MALITIVDKNTGDTLTAAEWNQILDALKDGTLEINTAGIQLAGTSLTPTAAQINKLATNASKGGNLLGRDGSGVIDDIDELNGDPNIDDPLGLLNIPFWVKKTINHDDTSPVTITAIEKGWCVHRVIVEVTETWDDGSKALIVGHDIGAGDDNAFITDIGAGLGTAKYYGITHTYWGSSLYDGTDKHSKLFIADDSGNFIVTFTGTGNGGSQGRCVVYLMLSRLY
ncbi:MAG: hypothetical protein JW794_02625 [Candidatus Cloacimonetes bacterium]|nr:hypothetical protein [Candidatus Cloacimonadota bacterium]